MALLARKPFRLLRGRHRSIAAVLGSPAVSNRCRVWWWCLCGCCTHTHTRYVNWHSYHATALTRTHTLHCHLLMCVWHRSIPVFCQPRAWHAARRGVRARNSSIPLIFNTLPTPFPTHLPSTTLSKDTMCVCVFSQLKRFTKFFVIFCAIRPRFILKRKVFLRQLFWTVCLPLMT